MTNDLATRTAQISPAESWDSVSVLARCLALVRPVSMSDEMASDWIAAAAAELQPYPEWLVKRGLATARKEASYHGQIVPLAMKAMEGISAWKPLSEYRRAARVEEYLPIDPGVARVIDGASKALTRA